MRLRRIVEGRRDALAVAGKDDADAEVLDEQGESALTLKIERETADHSSIPYHPMRPLAEQDQVIERVLQDVLHKSQWNAVGMCLLSGLLLLLLLLLL